jgi:hypothetical protein
VRERLSVAEPQCPLTSNVKAPSSQADPPLANLECQLPERRGYIPYAVLSFFIFNRKQYQLILD